MRITILFWATALTGIAVLGACTKPNPNTCCVTAAQCEQLGADELRPCAVGQACKANGCVASECTSSLECTSPDAPICVHNLCVGACMNSDECADVPGRPYCAAEGTCVGCTDAAQCPNSAAICDADTRACRGCALDHECASGVCIEADGACATPESLLYVSTQGTDVGDCNVAAPCRTISYGLQHVTDTRAVIRLIGTTLTESAPITIPRSVIIDGAGAEFYRPATGPMFALTGGTVTLEGVTLRGSDVSTPAIAVGQSSLRLVNSTISRGQVVTTSGTIDARDVTVAEGVLSCTTGTLSVADSRFMAGQLDFSSCQVVIQRNRFDSARDQTIQGTGGFVKVVNNLLVANNEYTDLVYLIGTGAGSTFAFNTLVNTASAIDSGVALYCDISTRFTSNLIAYNSTNPIGGTGCMVEHSLFDTPAGADVDVAGNTLGDASTFFVNRVAGDYRLASGSPAIGLGEAGVVDDDLLGAARPSPPGSAPDVGAYEAP